MTARRGERVVVTGMGAVTPLGGTFPESWAALVAGRAADAPVEIFDPSGSRAQRACSARLPALPGRTRKALSRLSRASRLALPAAREALAQAGLLQPDGRCAREDLALSVATTAGGMAFGENFCRDVLEGRRAHLFSQVERYLPQQQVLDLQQDLAVSGPSLVTANACASGANAIGHAADLIRAGESDCVLAGGFEALCQLVFVGFDCLQATTTEKCRPFDLTRSGLTIGEAGAFLVLEARTAAEVRGATILAELTGYGHGTDLFHLTQPQPAGEMLVEVMRDALRDAGLEPAQIGYLNAHGTGTAMNDGAEALAYRALFGAGPGTTRLSSTKAAIGHTLGAAGAVEALFAIAALRSGDLPPQLNLRAPIPEIASALVARGEKRADLRHVMTVNLGFGGSNAALVFSRMNEPAARSGVDRQRKNRPPTAAEDRLFPPSAGMNVDLAIVGQGAVTPAGVGLEALLRGEPRPQPHLPLAAPPTAYPVLRVDLDEPALARWQKEPRLRRASPMTYFIVEAAAQALGDMSSAERAQTGLIVALSAGCLIYSRRFFQGLLRDGPRAASPALFPETVFNSPGSHVAAVLGLNGAVYALCGDESAWIGALKTAAVWLRRKRVRQVVVVGAEEFDPLVLDAYRSARWLRRPGFCPSEGAGALLVRAAGAGEAAVIAHAHEGPPYRTPAEARFAAAELFHGVDEQLPCHRTARRTWAEPLESEAAAGRPEFDDGPLPYLGAAFTASAAWETIRAARMMSASRSVVPIWGLNHRFGRLDLRGACAPARGLGDCTDGRSG